MMPDNSSSHPAPLAGGYYRRDSVTAEIFAALSLDDEELRRRILRREFQSETLVYLFRANYDSQIADDIYVAIARHIRNLVRKVYGKFDLNIEDFADAVEFAVLEKILDINSTKGDFAQANFVDFVLFAAKNEQRKHFKQLQRDNLTQSIDVDPSEVDGPLLQISANDISPEKIALLNEAFQRMGPDVSEAYKLYYLGGWSVESSHINEPTLARHFDKSGRTIRTWLRRGEKIMSEYRGIL